MAHFFIPYQIRPQPRPRVFTRHNNLGQSSINVYDPIQDSKSAIRELLREMALARGFKRIPRDVPVAIQAVFMARKKSKSQREIPIGDVDNMLKTLLDCIQGSLIEDDIQVVSLHGIKVYGERHCCLFDIGEATLSSLDLLKQELNEYAKDQICYHASSGPLKGPQRQPLEPTEG